LQTRWWGNGVDLHGNFFLGLKELPLLHPSSIGLMQSQGVGGTSRGLLDPFFLSHALGIVVFFCIFSLPLYFRGGVHCFHVSITL